MIITQNILAYFSLNRYQDAGSNISKKTAHQKNPLKIQIYRVEVEMNHHYIDYMIKHRQQMEIEDCKRRRLLKTADRGNSLLIHKIVQKLSTTLRRVITRLEPIKHDHPTRFSVVHLVNHRKGEET